jgi:hypothetical protein
MLHTDPEYTADLFIELEDMHFVLGDWIGNDTDAVRR